MVGSIVNVRLDRLWFCSVFPFLCPLWIIIGSVSFDFSSISDFEMSEARVDVRVEILWSRDSGERG